MGSFGPTFRLSVRRPLLAAAIFAIFGLAGLTGPAAAQGTVKSVHSDWQVRCDTPPGAQGEQCALLLTAELHMRPRPHDLERAEHPNAD